MQAVHLGGSGGRGMGMMGMGRGVEEANTERDNE